MPLYRPDHVLAAPLAHPLRLLRLLRVLRCRPTGDRPALCPCAADRRLAGLAAQPCHGAGHRRRDGLCVHPADPAAFRPLALTAAATLPGIDRCANPRQMEHVRGGGGVRADEWAALQQAGETAGAPVDLADGFVHFSTAEQAAETAAKHFAGAADLTLLACEAEAMGEALKWEVSRGGALFPHLYRNLRMADVLWAEPLPLVGDAHQFPDKMT